MKTFYRIILPGVIAFIMLPQHGVAQSWQTFTQTNTPALPDTSVSVVGFDSHGNTWVGMTHGGLLKYDGAGWALIDDPNMPTYAQVSYIAEHNGMLWVATHDGNGLAKFDGTTWTRVNSKNSGLNDDSPFAFLWDNNQNMWIATETGLCEWKTDNTWLTYLSSQPNTNFPGDAINGVLLGTDGKLWLSFYSAYGMVIFDPASGTGTVVDANTYPALPADHISSMALDWNNNVWASTFTYGLARINGANVTVFSKETDAAFISDHVYSVTVDRCGHVWIATDAGVAMYDGSTWTKYSSTNSPLPHNHVNAISVGNTGHIWCATDGNGLGEYKPIAQKSYLASPATNSIIPADSVLCIWAWDCPGIERYWFEIADNNAFTNSTVDTTNILMNEAPEALVKNLVDHTTYFWRVRARNDQGWGAFSDVWQFTVTKPIGVSQVDQILSDPALAQNIPNPFNDVTTIRFSIPQQEHVRLSIYDLLGREIAVPVNGASESGTHELKFSVSEFKGAVPAGGVYLYQLQCGNTHLQRMMQVLR